MKNRLNLKGSFSLILTLALSTLPLLSASESFARSHKLKNSKVTKTTKTRHHRSTGGTPSPTPSPTPSATPSPTPSATPSPTPSATPSPIVADAQGIISLSGNKILDPMGRVFVPRGVELVTASTDQVADIDNIAAMGANSLRMLLTLDTANGMTPEAFDLLVGRAVQHNLVIWISLFTWDDAHQRAINPALGGGNLQKMEDYLVVWQRQWLKDLVNKYKDHIVIDAMQEFINSVPDTSSDAARDEWANAAIRHIQFFRANGYTNPLEIMTSFQGRDLFAITSHADQILAADNLIRNGQPQTLFGWQAYWDPDWYKTWQGELFLGVNQSITATQAVNQFVATRNYPIMVGLDSTGGDLTYQEAIGSIMPACAQNNIGWLWWDYSEVMNNSYGSLLKSDVNGYAGASLATFQ